MTRVCARSCATRLARSSLSRLAPVWRASAPAKESALATPCATVVDVVIGKKGDIARPRIQAPLEKPRTPPPAPVTEGQRTVTVTDAEQRKLGAVVDKSPAKNGGTSSARSVMMDHTRRAAGSDEIDRRFIKGAYKELANNPSLGDHVAMRAMAVEHGAATLAAFDEIMKAHAEVLLPQLLESAHVFAGATSLLETQSHAHAMGHRAAFNAALRDELVLAHGWAKNDHERSEVSELAARLGISLENAPDPIARVYEASPKHHASTVQGGFVSPAPTTGQLVLDASVQVKPESPRRVGVDKGAQEYVVFDETVPGTFHGHMRTWDQRHPDMQRALVAAGAATNNGRIL